jgi:hypothetical protein
MSDSTNSTPVSGFNEDSKRILVSRLGGTYAAPVLASVKASDTAITLTCIPMVVLKADNVKDDKGTAITVAQCQWSITATLTFKDDTTAGAFVTNARKLQSMGDAALCILDNTDTTVSVYWGTCVVGVSPAKGRGALATAICAALPPAISAADVESIREGITGEAVKRNAPDVTGKVNAALAIQQAATLAALVAAGVNPAVAVYLSKGESLPEGWTMAGPPVATTGGATMGKRK